MWKQQALCIHPRGIGFKHLFGIELQKHCVLKAKELHPEADIIQGSAFDIPFRDKYFDLVFTNNVLIHFSPKDIDRVLKEIWRVSCDYIWGFEYYAPHYVEVSYRGHADLLWKTDFAGEYMQRYPDLKLVQENMYEYQDEKGLVDKMYLLQKK